MARDIDIAKCLRKIIPDHKFSVVDNDYTLIKKHELETRAIPTMEQITSVWLEVLKEIKEAEMRDKAALSLRQIVAPYSQEERETWHRQVAEAEAYLADPNATTLMLDALVAQRGNTKLDQATRIRGNRIVFEMAVGTILGIQQSKLDIIAAATTVEEVEAVTW